MKNKIIFASTFLSLALVVGSLGSVFANEVAPADNQPVATNEAEQPAENAEKQEQPVENSEAQPSENSEQPVTTNEEAQPAENAEKPAENNEGATTDNKESAEYKYVVRHYLCDLLNFDQGIPVKKRFGSTLLHEIKTNNPLDIVPRKLDGFEYIGSFATFDGTEPIIIENCYSYPQIASELRTAIYNGEMDGKKFKAVTIDEKGNITYLSNKAKKSKSPNTSDPASVGLGVMAMVSAIGGLATLRKKK